MLDRHAGAAGILQSAGEHRHQLSLGSRIEVVVYGDVGEASRFGASTRACEQAQGLGERPRCFA